jgi:hypothetical protein
MDRHDPTKRSATTPETTSSRHEMTLEQVQVSAGLARLHRVRAALLASGAEVVTWTEPSRANDPDPLVSALALALGENRGLDFAFAAAPSTAVPLAGQIYRHPVEIAGIAIRADAIRVLERIDFGPPDAVLDGATGWALASVLTLCGLRGQSVCIEGDRGDAYQPESIGELSPVGIAWLITQTQRWARQGGEAQPVENDGEVAVVCVVDGVGRSETRKAPVPIGQSMLELGAGR